jgi:hypothetical protein
MNSSQIKFQPLASFDLKKYKRIVNSYVPYSDHNFTSLYCWDTADRCEVAAIGNDGLLIKMDSYIENPESEFLFTVAGKTSAEAIEQCLSLLEEKAAVDLIPPYIVNRLNRAGAKKIRSESDRDNYDYVLSTKEYVELSGKRFANKRKKINNFTRVFGDKLTIHEVSHSELDKKSLLKLYKDWTSHETDGSKQAQTEYLAFSKLLENPWLEEAFELVNVEYRLDGKLCGFSVSEVTGSGYAVGHFMKADLEIRYLYDYIVYHTVKLLREKYNVNYFNIEQDLGIEGLRTYKERHNPYKYLKKYRITQY